MHKMLITEGIERSDLFEKLKAFCETNFGAYVVIREKTMASLPLYQLVKRLTPIVALNHIQLQIHDRTDIALLTKTAGIHLPERGVSPSIPKKWNLFVGCSVHTLESALKKEKEGADYLLFGPIFETPNKQPVGLRALQEVTAHVKIPVFALGGIRPEHISVCQQAGAIGVAGIRLFWNNI